MKIKFVFLLLFLISCQTNEVKKSIELHDKIEQINTEIEENIKNTKNSDSSLHLDSIETDFRFKN